MLPGALQGVQFMFVKKAGLGVAMTVGSGFALTKVNETACVPPIKT